MRKIILYIATSLDGYIARKNGGIDWLFSDFEDHDYGYTDLYNAIDTTLIGNSTYKQMLTFGEFPYSDKTNYVFTSNRSANPHPDVEFIHTDIGKFAKRLKSEEGKNIWLVGGSRINTILLKANLIDELIVSIHPVILGNGIPLFEMHSDQSNLTLIKCETYPNGLVQMAYEFN